MIAAIELAILETLRAAGEDGVLGYRFAVLDSFPDEFEEYLKATHNLRTPAAWIVFLGMDRGEESEDGSGWNARCRFALVVGAQNLRNERQTRHGDGAEPGSYQLMADAIRLLSRSMLGLDLVEPVTVPGARLVSRSDQMKRQNLSLIAIELECRAAFGLFDEDTGAFEALHVDWDVPAFGNVAPPLPADAPDAEDLMELPQ
jgi:phage gp37-like protein